MKLDWIRVQPSLSSGKYWEGCSREVLVIQRCDDCHAAQFYPRTICSSCWSKNLSWIETGRTGEVYSHTTVHRAPSMEFKAIVPYVLVYVKLAHDLLILGFLEPDASRGPVKIGERVEMRFEEIGDNRRLPVFRAL